jgi:catechol 2,3-dioxygenase-like lactoylglutathione lyase family enzyme
MIGMAIIRYLVQNTEEAVAFYTQQLGFSLVNNLGPFAIVSKDGLTLWLADPRTSAAQPVPDGRIPEPGGWNRLVIEVDDLASVVETLKAAGTSFRNEIISGVGGLQVLVEDPSGNPIELNQPSENRP